MGNIIGGVVRACLAAIGGYLVNKGLASSEQATTITNSADAIVGVATVLSAAAWSWISKRNTTTSAK